MRYQKSSLQFSLQTHPFISHFFYWYHLSHGLLYLKLLERIIFWPQGNVEAVSAQRDWVKKLWGQGASLAQEARHLLTYPGHHAFSSPSLWAQECLMRGSQGVGWAWSWVRTSLCLIGHNNKLAADFRSSLYISEFLVQSKKLLSGKKNRPRNAMAWTSLWYRCCWLWCLQKASSWLRLLKLNFINIFPLGESELYTISLPASEFHSLLLTVAPRIHFMLSLEAALSQLFPLPIHLSQPRDRLFRNASGGDAAELLQYSGLLPNQELLPEVWTSWLLTQACVSVFSPFVQE